MTHDTVRFGLIGYGASTSIGENLLSILYIQVPRVRLFEILPGTKAAGTPDMKESPFEQSPPAIRAITD